MHRAAPITHGSEAVAGVRGQISAPLTQQERAPWGAATLTATSGHRRAPAGV